MIRLLLKKYTNGMFYLCKRTGEKWEEYTGSGVLIPSDVVVQETQVLGVYDSEKKLVIDGRYYSKLWNVVENPKFYNKVVEEGQGGDRSLWIRYPMGVYITCKMCGKVERVPKSHGSKQYCSRKCSDSDKEKYKRVSKTLTEYHRVIDNTERNKKISESLKGNTNKSGKKKS